jgi:hypothetical protein
MLVDLLVQSAGELKLHSVGRANDMEKFHGHGSHLWGLSTSDHSAQLRKAVIASTIGTTIEWYDFFIYGTAAGLIFGKLYFPNEDPLTATLAAFGGQSVPGQNSALKKAFLHDHPPVAFAVAVSLALSSVLSTLP